MIVFSDGAQTDLERILEFNVKRDPDTALDHIETIRSGVLVLNMHPEVGRKIAPRSTLRELIISKGATGYVALYEYFALDDLVVIHAVRHQREAGY
ncbi:MAG: type II toxin-antitoxin system RelE/ParE family toxin [Betaproteobacteria bacterium]|nr:type II toxin-antitoxin system RelE/ParE family toxin [Betaproteobacteria bacterium]